MDLLKSNSGTIAVAMFLAVVLGVLTIPFKKRDYIFEWDQAKDYESVAKIVMEKKPTLIGPRVSSDTGFFLGPWHYYFLTPFFILTKGSLEMGFWAAWLVQYLLALTSYVLAKKWFGTLAGVTAGLWMASPVELVAWGFMYTPWLSLIFFYLCLKTLEKPELLPGLFWFCGFGCTTYAVFYAMLIPLLLVTIELGRKGKISWRKLGLAIGLFLVSYIPTLIFDIRHNFLNIRNIMKFSANQQGSGMYSGYFWRVFLRAVETSWLNKTLPTNWSAIVTGGTILVLIGGAMALFKKRRVFVLGWLISPLIPMAFYRGNVSEYYYAATILLIPFLIAGWFTKMGLMGKSTLVLLILLVVFLRAKEIYRGGARISLADKINVLEELEKLGTKYSVSYELNLGDDNGYETIFRKLGKNYVADGSAQLYTITYNNRVPTNGKLVSSLKKLSIYRR